MAHLRDRAAFSRALARQAVWPDRLVPPVAWAVTAAEVSLGAAGFAALAAEVFAPGQPWAAAIARPVTGAAAVMYACFTFYSFYLVRRRPDVPCGCSMTDDPVGWPVVGRAAVLAVACGAAALAPQGIGAVGIAPAGIASAAGLLVCVPVVAFIVLAWSLPAALRQPE